MGVGRANGAHFMEHDAASARGDLPCGLGPGEAAADDVNGFNRGSGHGPALRPAGPQRNGGTGAIYEP
ncbi:hypothetical protein GCM10022626_25980 [[Pseudomonas] carboxydohydrogena]